MSLSLRQIKQDSSLNTVGIDDSPFMISPNDISGYSYLAYTSTGTVNSTPKSGDKSNIVLCCINTSTLDVTYRIRIIADSSNCLHPYIIQNSNILYLAYSQEISSTNTANTAQYNVIIRSYTISGVPYGSQLISGETFPTDYNTSTIRLTNIASPGNIKPKIAYNTITNEILLAWNVYGDISFGGVNFPHNTTSATSSFYPNIGFALFTISTNRLSGTLSKIYKDTRIDPPGLKNTCILHGLIYDSTRRNYIFSYNSAASGKTSGISTTATNNYFLCDISLTSTTSVTTGLSGLVNVYYSSSINRQGMTVDSVSPQNILLIKDKLYVVISAKTSNTKSIPYSFRQTNAWNGVNIYDVIILVYSYVNNKWNLIDCRLDKEYNTPADDIYPSITYDVSNNYIGIAYGTLGLLDSGVGSENIKSGGMDIVLLYYDTFLNNIYSSQNRFINTLTNERTPIITSYAGDLYIAYSTLGILTNGIASGNEDIVIVKYKPLYIPSIYLFTAVETVNTVTLYWLKNPSEKVDQFIIYYKEVDKDDSSYKLLDKYLSNDINYISLYSYSSMPSALNEDDATYNQYVLKTGYKYTFKIEPVVNSIFGTPVTTVATVISSYSLSFKNNNTNTIYTTNNTLNSISLYNYYENTVFPDMCGIDVNSYTNYNITYIPRTIFNNSGDIVNTEKILLNGYTLPKLSLTPTIISGNDVSNTSINVSWSQIQGSQIDKIIVNYGTTPSLGTTRVVASNLLNTNISGLTSNTLYYFKLGISGTYMLTDLNDAPISANTTTGLNDISSVTYTTVSGNSIVGRIGLNYVSSENIRTGQNPIDTEASFGYYTISGFSKIIYDITQIMLSTTTTPSTLTGISLAGTLYDVSSSSVFIGVNSYGPQLALRTIPEATVMFHTVESQYNSNGIYTGTINTSINGTNISGEWYEILGGTPFISNSLLFTSRVNYTTRIPKKITIAGSNDGSNWTSILMNQIIDFASYTLLGTQYRTFTVNFANTKVYKRYRVIFQEIHGDTCVNLSQCIFTRNDYISTIVYDIPQIILSSATTPNGITGIPLGNAELYDVSSSSVFIGVNSYGPQFALRTIPEATVMFHTVETQYNNINGIYSGTINTLVNGTNISGEWYQISGGTPFICTSLLFTSRFNYTTRIPKKITIAGSNDGTIWTSILMNQFIDFASYTILGTQYRTFTVNFANTKAYTRYRVIFQEIHGDTCVNLSQCIFTRNDYPTIVYDISYSILSTTTTPNGITGISLAGTLYDVSSSSFFFGDVNIFGPQKALNIIPEANVMFHTDAGLYSNGVYSGQYNSNGAYSGTINTLVSYTNISGEWYQISGGTPFISTSLLLTSRNGEFKDKRIPKKITIAGSNDGTIWTSILMNQFINLSSYTIYTLLGTQYGTFTVNFSNTTAYTRYRVIFQEIHGDNNSVNLSQCIFNRKYVISTRTVYNISCDISHMMLSSNTTPSTLTGIPLWTGALYDVSASSVYDSFNGPQKALNTIQNSSVIFYTQAGIYNNLTTFEGVVANGVYSGTKNTIVSGVNVSGEWFQISGGTAFICNSLLTGGSNGIPRRITIAGSNDGTTWTSLLMNQIIYNSNKLYDLSYVLLDISYRTCTVNFANTISYTRYRVIFQESTSSSFIGLSQCIFMRNYYPTRQYDILLANENVPTSNIGATLDANNIYDLSASSIFAEANSLRYATKLGIINANYYGTTVKYTASGLNNNTTSTSLVGGTTLSGEWVQISNRQYGMILNGILFASRTNQLTTGYPKKIAVAGSFDGTTWNLIQKDILIPDASYNTYNINNLASLTSKLCTVYFANITAYRIYRVIIQEIFGTNSIQLAQCVFIQRPFMPNNSNILIETQKLETNLTGINIDGQTYDVSASSFLDSRYDPENALQARPTDFFWRGNDSNYTGTVLIDGVSTIGAYQGVYSTTVNGISICGEWFQIKSNASKPIILNTIQLTSRRAYTTSRYPRRITIAGSNNGTAWEIILKSLFIPDASYSLINNNQYKSTTIMFDNDIPYTHYRVIFQEVHASVVADDSINLSQCIFSQNFNPITFYNGNTYYPIIKTYNATIKSNGITIPYTSYPSQFTTISGSMYSTVTITTDTIVNTSYIYFDISNTYVNKNIEGAYVEYKLASDLIYTETYIIMDKITRRITLENLIPGKTYNYRISPYIFKYNSTDKIVHTEKLTGNIITKLSRPRYIEPAYIDISNLRVFFDVSQSYASGANRYKIKYTKPTLSTVNSVNDVSYNSITTDISISDISSVGYFDISAFDNRLAKLLQSDIKTQRPYYIDINVSQYINTDTKSESDVHTYRVYIPYNTYSDIPDEVYQIAPATQIYLKFTSVIQSLIVELSRPLNNFVNLEYTGVENIRLYYYISGVTPVKVMYKNIDSSYNKISGLKPGNIYKIFLSYNYTLFYNNTGAPYNSITQVQFKTISVPIIIGYDKPSAPILVSLSSSNTLGREITINFNKKTSYIN